MVLMVLLVLLVTSLVGAQCAAVPQQAAPAPAEQEEAAGQEETVEKETVKLAFIGPLTGGNAAMGLGGRNSFELAVNEENENPENQYQYEVVVIDDECKPDVGVQAALKAASDSGVIAAASHYCSMVAISTADTFHQHGLPSMVWGAVLPDITYGNDYVEITRVNGTMALQNQVNAQFTYGNGYEQVSVIHDTSDYGRGHMEYFTEAFEELGGEILSIQGVTVDQTDFTAELTNIKAEDPDAIYFGGLTPLGVSIKSQMDKLGMNDIQFMGTSGIKNDSFNESLGEAAEGVVCFLEGAPTEKLPGGQEFLEKYDAAGYQESPEAYGPFAYVAAKLIIDAIEKVGPDRAAVAEELENNTESEDTIIGEVTFDDHGQNIVPLITGYVSQDGEWVPWDDSAYASGERSLIPPE
jgi:branched-chain amino acid transport system substrate-binding protein